MSAMSDKKAVASQIAKRLNMTTATLYTYLNGDGSLKDAGKNLFEGKKINDILLKI
jgi:hypothetical protein